MEPDEVRLDRNTWVEWWDISRILKPGMTWDEFEEFWVEFQQVKTAHFRNLALH
jgi:hypothetical protein